MGGEPPILQKPLIRRGIVGLDEGLMPLLQFGWGASEGELIVVQPPLDIEVGLDQVLIALPLGTLDGLMGELQPGTDLLKCLGGVVLQW
jgi:hypothetical protein